MISHPHALFVWYTNIGPGRWGCFARKVRRSSLGNQFNKHALIEQCSPYCLHCMVSRWPHDWIHSHWAVWKALRNSTRIWMQNTSKDVGASGKKFKVGKNAKPKSVEKFWRKMHLFEGCIFWNLNRPWKVKGECSIHGHWVTCRSASWARAFTANALTNSIIQASDCRQLSVKQIRRMACDQ